MNYNNLKHIAIYIFVLGLFLYLLHAALQAIFIISLPMEDGWAVDAVQTEEREYITQFKNELEEAKYYHNVDMLERNRYLLYGEFLVSFGISYLVFYFIPRWRGTFEYRGSVFFSLGAITFVSLLVVPFICQLILPPPSTWFPHVFTDINEKLVQSELEHLKKIYTAR